ncbi:MAG: nucleotide sugar dehydrogenase [Candidatus Sumerlaeales bacterium]|nr:nucleotide sugar dehydrogenase [Candidatus Sumerlaeales bacterium]
MKTGVVGLGYVGLPLLVEIAKSGINAVGIDVDTRKVNAINRGENYISDVKDEELTALVKEGKLQATTDWSVISELDAVSICVPTPLRKTKDPDISFIVNSVEAMVPYIKDKQLIILESTTYPGTTDEILRTAFEHDGKKVGVDFHLAFSPERVDPGNPKFKTKNTPKIIGGATPECTKKAVEYYSMIFEKVVPVSSTQCAEMVKLLENTFRSVNIGLVNEVALMCDKLGLDVWEVIDAAATKPFGFMPFYPGPGLGGHCIPIDPLYLSWKLRGLNFNARFIELASAINASMPEFVVEIVARALNDVKKSINGSTILILGVAYKANITDVRESPAADIIDKLVGRGANIVYSDPFVPKFTEAGHSFEAQKLTKELVEKADCVAILANHSDVDYSLICENASLIVDTRNALKGMKTTGKLVKL